MGIIEDFKFRKGKNGLTKSGISNEVSVFTDKVLSKEAFSGLGPDLYELLKIYDTSETIHNINEVLRHQMGPRIQTEKLITEIPPEGIIIDKPGTYTFAPPAHEPLGSPNKLTWSPDTDMAAAITIVSSDVVLDLDSGNLAAHIQDSSQHLVGIFVFGASNVTIKNGALTNMCLYGIQAELVEQLTIENINISGLEYSNKNIRGASPAGIQVNLAKSVCISDCQLQYFYVSADSCSGIQLLNTLTGTVENCTASNLYNYAGMVTGFCYAKSSGISTVKCHADGVQSHFGGNIRTGGHTVLGFLPVLCYNLEFDNCSAKNITGSCDDCHGMSVFINAVVKVNNFHADGVTDGVTQFNTGAKATGLEVYGVDVQITNCTVNNIRAINPQNKLSTGFSVWGAGMSLSHCTASNVSVSNDIKDQNILIGTGTGFGWAPDPRLTHTGAIDVTYDNCKAINCQVGFDTWNHIDSKWITPSYQNCAINILVEPGGVRTVYGAPCTECNPPVTITINNRAKNNVYPGSTQAKPNIRQAYPTGNINGLNLPNALSRLNDVESQWWFYVGLLQDDQGLDHSFELNFIEPGNVLGDIGITAVDFDFTFDSKGHNFHATSTYGGDEPFNILQSVINTAGFGKVVSQDKEYSINVNSLSGTNIQVSYDPEKTHPTASMFTGQIGQPGGAYKLEGQGSTWLWKYSESGKREVAPYQYSLKIHLIDERGLVPEGLGSYVGIDPIHPPSDAEKSSVEYAQPRLRVTGWTIKLTRNPECWALSLWEKLEGFEENYSFQSSINNSGHIWLDRQALFNAPNSRHSHGRALMSQALAKAQNTLEPQQILNIISESKQSSKQSELANQIATNFAFLTTAEQQNNKQLYLGCWLPVILTDGAYAGSTLLFVAFWDSARAVANYDTDNKGDAKPNSFMNLYTGLLGPNAADIHSAYTVSDLLNPGAATGEKPNPENNYRIQYTKQFQSIGDLPDPQRWASEIEVTVKAHSQVRYALSAYAKRAGKEETSGVDKNLTFLIQTISPYTSTTMLSSDLSAPIYEGASRIYMVDGSNNKKEIGSGWVEQMVGTPSKRGKTS